MNKSDILAYVEKFLTSHPQLRPTESFTLGEPVERTVEDVNIFIVGWVDTEGRNARGGAVYYVFNDGTVIVPAGGSGAGRESEAAIVQRWKS